jgi:hypothetical protein
MKPLIEFRHTRPRESVPAPIKAPATPKAKAPPQAKSAAPKPAKPKAGKRAAKAKPPASAPAKPPRPTTATVAPDISGLKARFLAGTLKDADWDDITAILDAAEARRQKNKAKQQAWRNRKKP